MLHCSLVPVFQGRVVNSWKELLLKVMWDLVVCLQTRVCWVVRVMRQGRTVQTTPVISANPRHRVKRNHLNNNLSHYPSPDICSEHSLSSRYPSVSFSRFLCITFFGLGLNVIKCSFLLSLWYRSCDKEVVQCYQVCKCCVRSRTLYLIVSLVRISLEEFLGLYISPVRFRVRFHVALLQPETEEDG